jgi:PleD family two-component response regulator
MATQNRILIVEDDPDTAEMLTSYFEGRGYQILTAAWGGDALKLCRDSVPDLIIQDIRLPDIDGYQVVRELRESTRTSRVPVVFLTEKNQRNDKITGLRLGAVDYVTKPFDMQELHLRVRNALRRAGYTSLVSPITGLPGEQLVTERLGEALSEGHWAVLHIVIYELDAFGEAYGFVAADDVLRAVGLMIGNLVDQIGAVDDLVGHIDKAEFVVVTGENRAVEIREALAEKLSRAFHRFYPIQDIESGQVTSAMSAGIGLVAASSGPYESVALVLDTVRHASRTVLPFPAMLI